jgi:hypothetical protein
MRKSCLLSLTVALTVAACSESPVQPSAAPRAAATSLSIPSAPSRNTTTETAPTDSTPAAGRGIMFGSGT